MLKTLVSAFICMFAASAWGQSARRTPNAFPPPPASSVATAIDQQLLVVEKNIVGLAEAMPAEKYNFSPESLSIPGSQYNGVRNFAMQVIHVAAANYLFWSSVVGEPIPDGILAPNPKESFRTKESSVRLLKDSFALGHRVAATLSAENLLDQFPSRNARQTRLFLATYPIIHANDIYGQMVEYLRMNGQVPPASVPGEY